MCELLPSSTQTHRYLKWNPAGWALPNPSDEEKKHTASSRSTSVDENMLVHPDILFPARQEIDNPAAWLYPSEVRNESPEGKAHVHKQTNRRHV